MTLYSHVNRSLNTSVHDATWGLGLPYRSGQQTTLYINAEQLFNFTGLTNTTYIGTRTGGHAVSSISSSLPQTAHCGVTYGGSRSVLTVVLDTPSESFRGSLQAYIQAYSM